MKYDLLYAYRSELEKKYSYETARTYFIRVDKLLSNQIFISDKNKISLDFHKILEEFRKIKYKSYFSQSKNAFLHFCKFYNIHLSNEFRQELNELKNSKKKKYRRLERINFSDIDKKIKYLRNKKLKLSFQTLIATGLRVSELSQITPHKIVISEESLIFSFIGKGGNKETHSLYKKEYPKLFHDLIVMINNTEDNKRLFYSSSYLQDKAKELGFKCHDLRRACAKIEYKKTRSKEKVKQKLRHTSIKNTNIYLRSKIKI